MKGTPGLPRWTPLIFSICMVLSGTACLSMPDNGQNGKTSKATLSSEFKSEVLTKEISLPYLSSYGANAQLLRGTLFPTAKCGASVTMHFTCKDSKDNVLAWFRNTYEANKWTLDRTMSNSASVSAKRDKYLCQVVVMPSTRSGSQCDFVLHYRFLDSIPNEQMR